MPIGQNYALQKQRYRARIGAPVTLTPSGASSAVTVPAERQSTWKEGQALMREGAGQNAAAAGGIVLEVSPAAIAAVNGGTAAPPDPGSSLTWNGRAYTVQFVPDPDLVGGVSHTYVIIAFQPAASAASQATQDGERKAYAPAASSL